MGDKGDRFKPLFTWRSAICESDLPATTRHIALTLSLYMSERGDSAHPGATLLARDTGLSVRAIREHLAELERLGWLELIEAGGIRGKKKRANEYRAVIPDPTLTMTGAGDAPVQEDAVTGEPDDADGSSSCTPSHQDLTKKSPSRRSAAPDSFEIDEKLRVWAADKAPDVDLKRETERFLDHHRAKGNTFKDWRAAWRTWMGNAQGYLERDGRVGPRAPSPPLEPTEARMERLGMRKCPLGVCNGDGWIYDEHGNPASRCDCMKGANGGT